MKNINYFQLFNTFIDTFSELGRSKSSNYFIVKFEGKSLNLDINICFSDRLGIDIFEINKCPLFLLQMLDAISKENFQILY